MINNKFGQTKGEIVCIYMSIHCRYHFGWKADPAGGNLNDGSFSQGKNGSFQPLCSLQETHKYYILLHFLDSLAGQILLACTGGQKNFRKI